MYLVDLLKWLKNKQRRKELFDISKSISIKEKRNRGFVIGDMLLCSVIYGAMFTEYENLSFYCKSSEVRSTYFTTFQEFKLMKEIENKKYKIVFHDKALFLDKFAKFINRKWWIVGDNLEELQNIIINNQKVVLKNRLGDSGKEVEVHRISKTETAEDLLEYMKKRNLDLVEEFVYNHPIIASLNKTSLNTIRIVTLLLDDECTILFAGIRVGAEGAELDNVSQGGAVAAINIETGCIASSYYYKKTVYSGNNVQIRTSDEGTKIPFWKDVILLVENAARVIPEISIVAWDVCLTNTGPEIIEGNESFGCVVMQVFGDNCALKPIISKKLLEHNIKIKL